MPDEMTQYRLQVSEAQRATLENLVATLRDERDSLRARLDRAERRAERLDAELARLTAGEAPTYSVAA